MRRSLAALGALALALATASGQQPARPGTQAGTEPGTEPGTETRAQAHPVSQSDRDRAEQAYMEGAKDLERRDLRAAMQAFAHAAELNPAEKKYLFAEEIARQHLVTDLIQQADKAKIAGHMDAWRADLTEAWHLDPTNPMVREHLGELRASAPAAAKPVLEAGKGEAETPGGLGAPIQLEPKPVRLSFHLRTNMRSLVLQVLSAYGIQATLDDSVGAQIVPYDVDDVDFAQAEQTLSLATHTFLVPLDPARALVATDTRANRDKYERMATETMYLPGMTSEELTQMVSLAREDFGAREATSEPSSSTITVRGPARELTAFNATMQDLLEGHSELQLDVRMYEVDRTKATSIGALLPTQVNLFNVYSEAQSILASNASLVQEIISSGLAAPGDWEAILAILIASGQVSNSVLSQPFAFFGGGLTMTGVSTSGGSLNLQLNSSDVHALDSLQLRVADHQEATIRSGERYPIITSSYSSLGSSSLSIPGLSIPGLSSTLQNLGISASQLASEEQETIPQVQYQNIGLTLVVTPHLQGPNRVSLKLDLKLSSLAGSSLNDLPLLDNREFSAITSMAIGQSTILTSALSRQESNAITGIPGLNEIPGFQDATNKNTNLDYSELAVVITPHIVRSVHQQEATEKMILLGVGDRTP